VFGAPASATFSGAGNPPFPPVVVVKRAVRCGRGERLAHGRCVKRRRSARKSAKGRK
jgi:hypothetical protein